jgi:transcriptional regulator with XRE-family HTH domain
MNVHYEPPVSSIAERLKEAMDIRGLTAAELSRATKITTASISHYLAGRYSPKQDKIYLLAKELHVNPAWLMGFDISMDNSKHYTVTDKGIARLKPLRVPMSHEDDNIQRIVQPMKETLKKQSIAIQRITASIEEAEATLHDAVKNAMAIDLIFQAKYSQLTAENKHTLNAMLDTMLMAQKNATTADSDGGDDSDTQKGTPSLKQVPSREKETNKPCE